MCPACLLFMRKKCDGFYVFIWKVSEDPFEPPPPLILPSHLLKTSLRKRGFHISMETHPLWGPCGVFLCAGYSTFVVFEFSHKNSQYERPTTKCDDKTQAWWKDNLWDAFIMTSLSFPSATSSSGCLSLLDCLWFSQHCGLSIGGLPLTVNGLFVGEQWAISAPTESPG